MALDHAPNAIRAGQSAVGDDKRLTRDTHTALEEQWRQLVAGFVIVPCVAAGTDIITLTPRLHAEGAATYGDGMTWCAAAVATSTGAVTAGVGNLPVIKVYKSDGAAQAGAGDIVQNCVYLFIFNSALDAGSGGMIIK